MLTPMNQVISRTTSSEPVVGMGATQLMWSDRHPFTVVEVLSAKEVVVQADRVKRVDGNGMSEDQEYEYVPNPAGKKYTITLRKNGQWVTKGQPLRNGQLWKLGEREEYHDFSY